MHTHTATHPLPQTHTHTPIYTLDMYYIQKEVCTDSLATNTIAKCNSPINTITYVNTQIYSNSKSYVSPLTIIQWTYVHGTEIYILRLARPHNNTQTHINYMMMLPNKVVIRTSLRSMDWAESPSCLVSHSPNVCAWRKPSGYMKLACLGAEYFCLGGRNEHSTRGKGFEGLYFQHR